MRYPRQAFHDDPLEKAYLLGLRAGDVNAWRKSPYTIEVRVSTTHPAMSELFSESFEKYGHLMSSPEPAYLPGRYCWHVRVHLENSFDFLVEKTTIVPRETEEFYHFLSGYADSESCWCIYKHGRRFSVSWSIESKDVALLGGIKSRLESNGFHPLFYLVRTKRRLSRNGRRLIPRSCKWKLKIGRKQEIVALARELLPLSLHTEKRRKMHLILESQSIGWTDLAPKLNRLRNAIRDEAQGYEERAKRAFKMGKIRP